MWVVRAILTLVAIVVIGGFFLINVKLDQQVTIDLYWKRYEDVWLIYVSFWSFVAGMVTSMMLLMGAYIKQLTQLSSSRRTIKGLKEEVAALRNRPIEEPHDLFGEGAAASPQSEKAEMK